MRLRKNMKRAAAAALALSVAVSAAMPASAGYKVDMSQVKGDVTITKDAKGDISVSAKDNAGVTETEDDSVTISGGKGITTESKTEETTPVKQESTEKKGVVSGGRVMTSSMSTRLPGSVGNGAVVTSGTIARGGMVRSSVQSQKSANEDVATYEDKDELPLEKVATAFENAIKYVVKIINNSSENLDVTLENVNIKVPSPNAKAAVSVEGTGDTTIKLKGENYLTGGPNAAGLGKYADVDANGNVTGGSTGKLTITADSPEAGKLTATGGMNAAGIGGGRKGDTANIEIAGGTVAATGKQGAGIGGGVGGSAANIKISGGVVTATGEMGAAGIGSGAESMGYGTPANIDYSNDAFNIEITGGTVTANGKGGGAGIGGGNGGNAHGIEISKGTVNATGGSAGGSGIGGGARSDMDDHAEADKGGYGEVTISGDANVTAKGGTSANGNGAAIGDGAQGGGVNGEEKADLSGLTSGTVTRLDATATTPEEGHVHKWVEEKQTATCEEDGFIESKCSECGATKTEVLKKLGHNWKTVKVDATCTKDGYTEEVCENCKETRNHKVIEASGHKYTELVEHKDATCTEDGYDIYKCANCDATEKKVLTKTGHKYTETVVEPTCTEQGYTLHTCVKGDHEYKDNYTDATGHHYVDTVVEPTCTEGGYTTHTCDKCGDTYTDNETKALGHDMTGEWEVVREATYDEPGEEITYCQNGCGHSETREIPQLVRDDSDNNVVSIDTAISVVNGSGTDILRDAAQVQLVQVGDVLYIEAASQDTAAVEGVLNDLSQLVENGVQTIVFTTSGRTSTIHLAEAVALGSSETPFTLSHNGADASLTVGGADHSELIH